MNVAFALTAVAYALVAAAFLPVALSGEIGVASPVAFLIAMAASLVRDPRTATPRPITARIWTGALLAAAAALVAWSWQDNNWLLHALQFALQDVDDRLRCSGGREYRKPRHIVEFRITQFGHGRHIRQGRRPRG